jgi:hypothetical protein
MLADVLEENIAAIFKAKVAKQETSVKQAASRALLAGFLFGLPPAFMLVSCLACFTVEMEAMCSSEMSADFQRTTQCYISGDRTLHNHRCENLKFYKNTPC